MAKTMTLALCEDEYGNRVLAQAPAMALVSSIGKLARLDWSEAPYTILRALHMELAEGDTAAFCAALAGQPLPLPRVLEVATPLVYAEDGEGE